MHNLMTRRCAAGRWRIRTVRFVVTSLEARKEAARDIFAYIEGFYNRRRRHSAIGYISPVGTELKPA